MATNVELMGLGTPAAQASAIGSATANTGLTGAGTSSQANALLLTSPVSVFGTVAANSGARLPPASGQPTHVIFNGGANALLLYPASGEILNGSSADASFSVTAAKSVTCTPAGNRWIVTLSA